MQNVSALIHSHDVITLPDEAEGWWFLTVSTGDVTPPTWETGSLYTITNYWPSVQWGIYLNTDPNPLYKNCCLVQKMLGLVI